MAISCFHPRMTSVFSRFLHFVGRRRALFSVFCISSADDGCFFAFSAFRRPTTGVFSRFLHFVGRRWAFFSDFCVSSADDELFSAFFCSSEGSESQFFAFFVHPRGRKPNFFGFLFVRGLGCPFFYFLPPSPPSGLKQIFKPNSHILL